MHILLVLVFLCQFPPCEICFPFFPLLVEELHTVFPLEACQNHRSQLTSVKGWLEELPREKARVEPE